MSRSIANASDAWQNALYSCVMLPGITGHHAPMRCDCIHRRRLDSDRTCHHYEGGNDVVNAETVGTNAMNQQHDAISSFECVTDSSIFHRIIGYHIPTRARTASGSSSSRRATTRRSSSSQRRARASTTRGRPPRVASSCSTRRRGLQR